MTRWWRACRVRRAERAGSVALAVLCGALWGATVDAAAQTPVERILEQDSTVDNLVDPPGYETGTLGELGALQVSGAGTTPMVLIPGYGFGGDVFEPLVERFAETHTVYAVTLAGFGGTPAPPAPRPGTSFGEQTWTNGAVDGVERLLVERDLTDAVLVGHWLGGPQVALRVARRVPDRVAAVVILAGSARFVQAQPNPARPPPATLAERVAGVDRYLAPSWFRTVTRETWDDNNFLPGDYAAQPVLGLRLWRQAARPPLHVWVRYLCEFFAQDVTLELGAVRAPILLVRPGLEGLFHEEDLNYMEAYLHRSWEGVAFHTPGRVSRTIPGTRAVPWVDDPDAVHAAMTEFLADIFPSERARGR